MTKCICKHNKSLHLTREDKQLACAIEFCDCEQFCREKTLNIEIIKSKVNSGLNAQFETYSWEDMLRDCDLTPEERIWAKNHLSYTLIEI